MSMPLDQWNGSDATRQLEATIKSFNAQADRQTQTMIRLTKWILVLTVLMAVAVMVQIGLALHWFG
jgi:hypothetical protein